MSNSETQLQSLAIFERKEYEELKSHFSEEAGRLRERKIFLGIAVVTFIATLAATGIIKIGF